MQTASRSGELTHVRNQEVEGVVAVEDLEHLTGTHRVDDEKEHDAADLELPDHRRVASSNAWVQRVPAHAEE
eukprot:685906-Rhodomonas_salina.6